MKKRNAKQILHSVLALGVTLFMIPSLFASAAGEHDGRLTDRSDHSDKKFGDYEYSRMNEDDFNKIIDGLDELVQDTANADAVLDVIIGMEDYYCELNGNYAIAHIHSDLVADDAYWDDEVKFYDELGTSVGDSLMRSYRTIALSPNSDVLHDRIDDEDEWQEILDYVDMTQEQKDLSAKETELSLQYDILYNESYTTNIGGKDYDEDQLSEANGNGTISRDEFLNGYADILKKKNEKLGNLYLELVAVRNDLAKSYGYDNYAEYAYDKTYDRDYTYDEMAAYRQSVKDYFIPMQDQMIMQLFSVYYDQYTESAEQKMPVKDCLANLRKYLPEISNDLLVSLDYMEQHDLYDLEVNDQKAPGGYTISISGYNAPFMYNCASGTYSDMSTLIHEFGHYNNAYYMTEDSWYYGSSDLDLAEIHSQGLEMLFLDFADDLYGDYADVMNFMTLYNMSYSAVEGVKEDEFQQRVYQNADGLTLEELNQIYYDCCIEYGGNYLSMMNNSIALAEQGYLDKNVVLDWVNIPHTFQSPMYYISYSVSVAAVFELFDQILDDRDQGIELYLNLVNEEFQDSYQNTITAAGLNNPIQNPRFDVYANDILYYAGMKDQDEWQEEHDAAKAALGGTVVEKPEEKPDEPEKPTVDDDEDDDDDDEKDREARDKDEDPIDSIGFPLWAIIALGVIAFLFVVVLIILIVVLVKRGKDKKNAQRPAGPIAPNSYVPNAAPGGTYNAGAPVNGGMNGGMTPGMNNRPGNAAANPMGGQAFGNAQGGYVQNNPYVVQSGEIKPPTGMPVNPYLSGLNGQGAPMQQNAQPMQNAAAAGMQQPMQGSYGAPQASQPMQQSLSEAPQQMTQPAQQTSYEAPQVSEPVQQTPQEAPQQMTQPAQQTSYEAPQVSQPVLQTSYEAPQASEPVQQSLSEAPQQMTQPVQQTSFGMPQASQPEQRGPLQQNAGPVPEQRGPYTAPNPYLQNLERMRQEENAADKKDGGEE